MKDDHKTKKQLIHKLTELRSQNTALKKSITVSVSADLVVEEARRYAESIVETVRESLLVLDTDLKIISANRNFYRAFKVTPDETIGSFIYDLGNKQWDIPKLRELLEEVLPEKEAFDDFEVAHTFQDIGHKVMLLNARQIYRKEIGTKMILLAIEDITEHKRLEDLLTESEGRYRHVFETASDGIVLFEKSEGKITHANQAIEKMLGYSLEETIGKKLQDIGIVDIDDFQTLMQILNKIGITNYTYIPVKTKSGQHINTDIYLADRARLVQCNIRDTSQRKQAEKVLQESEEKYRSLLDNASDAIFLADVEGNLQEANKKAEEILGYSREEISGIHISRIHPEEVFGKIKDIFNEIITKGSGYVNDVPILRKDGTIIPVDITGSLVERDGTKVLQGIFRDITERKRAVEALCQEYLFSNAIIDKITEGLCVCHETTEYPFIKFSIWNNRMSEITGYTVEEINRLGWHQTVYPDPELQAKAIEHMKRMRQGEDIRAEEWEITRADGGKRVLNIATSVVESNDGLVHVLALMQDITERKRAKEVLREDKERYRTLVENASDIVFRTDNSGNFTFVNPAGIRITGYEKEEMMGKHYPTLIHPDMRDEAMKFFGRQFVKGIQNTYLEYPLLTKEGHKLWFGQNTQLIFEGDHVVGFQAVARDITDRKQAEESLREQEIKLSSIFRAAPVGISMVINRVFQEANEMLCHMTGYNRKELLGKSARMLYPTQEDYDYVGQEKYRQISEKGTGTVETRWKRKDGTVIDIILSSTRLDPDNLAKGVTFTALDITDRKQAGEELREALVSLRKAFGATIQVLVSAVEIRDPYTSGHQIRSAGLARAIATEMGFTKERIDGIRMAGSIHDIGKLSIPAEILSKPTKLTNIEFSLIKEHSQRGYEMLKDVESPWPLAEIVYQHHERMDGSGYPRNLKGDDILMEARIMAVADVVESMASHRPYRPALGIDKALEEIEKNKGTLYDNAVADTCLRLFREKDFQL